MSNTFGNWDVVVVLVTLVGLLAAILGPVIKLTKAITKLTISVDSFEVRLATEVLSTKESFGRVWKKSEEHDVKIGDHEVRIHSLEESRDHNNK